MGYRKISYYLNEQGIKTSKGNLWGSSNVHSVLERNREAIEEKIINVAKYLDLENSNFEGFLDWILHLRKELKIPHTLKELINDDSKLEEMSKMALKDPSTGGNPIKLSQEEKRKFLL